MTPAERDRRLTAYATWRERHGPRLAELPEPTRIEVETVTLSRFIDGTHRAMTAQEMNECASRAASRLRIGRYGRLPTDDGEARRQLEECRAECGLEAAPMARERAA